MIKRKTSGKKATKKKVTKTTLKKSLKTLHLRLPHGYELIKRKK